MYFNLIRCDLLVYLNGYFFGSSGLLKWIIRFIFPIHLSELYFHILSLFPFHIPRLYFLSALNDQLYTFCTSTNVLVSMVGSSILDVRTLLRWLRFIYYNRNPPSSFFWLFSYFFFFTPTLLAYFQLWINTDIDKHCCCTTFAQMWW